MLSGMRICKRLGSLITSSSPLLGLKNRKLEENEGSADGKLCWCARDLNTIWSPIWTQSKKAKRSGQWTIGQDTKWKIGWDMTPKFEYEFVLFRSKKASGWSKTPKVGTSSPGISANHRNAHAMPRLPKRLGVKEKWNLKVEKLSPMFYWPPLKRGCNVDTVGRLWEMNKVLLCRNRLIGHSIITEKFLI